MKKKEHEKKEKKNTSATVARIALGAILVLFGLNKIVQFMPPPQLAEPAMTFFSALMATGYMWPLLIVVELSTGLMLLLNKSTPLALVLLAPLSVNIVLFHIFLDPVAGIPAYVVAGLNLYLLFVNKKSYDSLCACK